MTATIIDGKDFAARVRAQVAAHVASLDPGLGQPGLAVVLVGADPASEVYVKSKGRMTLEVGMASFEHRLEADTSEADLLALVARPQRGTRRCTGSWCNCRCRGISTAIS